MRDEMDARLWGEHHQVFSTEISSLTGRIMQVFDLLHRQHWTAPWAQEEKRGERGLSRHLAAVVGAILFSSTMILSAVGPAPTRIASTANHTAIHYPA